MCRAFSEKLKVITLMCLVSTGGVYPSALYAQSYGQSVQVDLSVLQSPTAVPVAQPLPVQPAYSQSPDVTQSNVRNDEVESAPVDFQADSLEHDDDTQVITASGNVVMSQAGRTLKADSVSYNLQTDTVSAHGNVVLKDINGDTHYADSVELSNKFKNGFVEGLKTYLSDGSRFTAGEGHREEGRVTTMNMATYTPCEPCKKNPDRPPIWQLRASSVTHDQEEHRVSYRNARFETFGVPIAYVPYFSHPDGSIKRKSGFLSPSAGYKSDLGAFVESSYYWNIAPDKDATIGLLAMTKEAPLGLMEWRQRWQDASLKLNGGLTYSERTDSIGGEDVLIDEELRGHVLGSGIWDMNEKWRSGLKVQWASDDQYMRQYDILDENILENEVYAERFSGRNYAVGRVLLFKDTRIRDEREDQPAVLPEMIASFKGEPDSVPVLGGRWGVDASFLGLQRSGGDQDMNRLALEGKWNRRFVSDYGLVSTADAQVRADSYNTRDRSVASGPGTGQGNSSTETRFHQNVHLQSSYPLTRDFESFQATVEPVVALTLASNLDVNNDIPNEDSQDVQVGSGNLFEPNRFPGLDRLEDKSRVTYGGRVGLYGLDGSRGTLFLGQSMRFDDDDNPFPEGSGLNEQASDFVGQITGGYKDRYNLDYRFQLGNDDLSSQRHEIDAGARWNRFSLSGQYLYARALEGTDIQESREQLQARTAYYISDDWRVRFGGTQDLGDKPGLRKAYTGIDYYGQCVSLSLTGQRNLTDDSSGESDTEILFRIGLKNLGEFETPDLQVPNTKD